MTRLATRLPDPRERSQRAGHDAGWTADDWTWLADHDPHADWRSPVPDPTAEAAIARVERERKRR